MEMWRNGEQASATTVVGPTTVRVTKQEGGFHHLHPTLLPHSFIQLLLLDETKTLHPNKHFNAVSWPSPQPAGPLWDSCLAANENAARTDKLTSNFCQQNYLFEVTDHK